MWNASRGDEAATIGDASAKTAKFANVHFWTDDGAIGNYLTQTVVSIALNSGGALATVHTLTASNGRQGSFRFQVELVNRTAAGDIVHRTMDFGDVGIVCHPSPRSFTASVEFDPTGFDLINLVRIPPTSQWGVESC